MLHTARLVIKEEWGTFTPNFYWNLASGRAWLEAQRRGHVTGLVNYRVSDGDKYEPGQEDGILERPIGLQFKLVYPDTENEAGSWTDDLYSKDYLEQHLPPFGENVPWLQHSTVLPGSYSDGPTIPSDTPWTLRIYLYSSPEGPAAESLPGIARARWAGYQLQIANDGGASLHKEKDTWTQEIEDDFDTLVALKAPTELQLAEIETKRALLYEYSESLSTGKKLAPEGHDFYELTFMPDRSGYIDVYSGYNYAGSLKHLEILRSRTPSIISEESQLTLSRKGGLFFWQTGYPEFVAEGVARYPFKRNDSASDEPWFGYIRSVEEDVTNVVGDITLINEFDAELTLTFSTTDTRKTPLLYAAQAFIEAGARDGGSTTLLDTDTVQVTPEAAAESPITNIIPQCEGEFRRAQYTVSLRDVNGTTFEALALHGMGENCTADLYIDGSLVVKNGLIKTAIAHDMKAATYGSNRSAVTKAYSHAELVICDKWALLEEYQLAEGELIGDATSLPDVNDPTQTPRLEILVVRALRSIGEPFANLNQIPGWDPNAGIFNWVIPKPLPKGVAGEGWCNACSSGSLADFLIQMIERYGMGATLWCGTDGKWYFGQRTTSYAQVSGQNAFFVSTASTNTDQTYPGRFAILNPLDHIHDPTDFYNRFIVIGHQGYNEEPIAYMYQWEDSFVPPDPEADPQPPQSQRWIGRIKLYPPVIDSGLRTANDVDYACRSIATKYGKPPRYYSFETYYHQGLTIGSRIKVDGVPCEICRAPDGDIAMDRMSIVAQEIFNVGGY